MVGFSNLVCSSKDSDSQVVNGVYDRLSVRLSLTVLVNGLRFMTLGGSSLVTQSGHPQLDTPSLTHSLGEWGLWYQILAQQLHLVSGPWAVMVSFGEVGMWHKKKKKQLTSLILVTQLLLLGMVYHRELAGATTSVIFVPKLWLSWQNYVHCLGMTKGCHNKTHLLLRQKYACCNKTCLFVATKLVCLSQQNFCCIKHNFVVTNMCLLQQSCCNKNYTCGSSRQW